MTEGGRQAEVFIKGVERVEPALGFGKPHDFRYPCPTCGLVYDPFKGVDELEKVMKESEVQHAIWLMNMDWIDSEAIRQGH